MLKLGVTRREPGTKSLGVINETPASQVMLTIGTVACAASMYGWPALLRRSADIHLRQADVSCENRASPDPGRDTHSL